MLILIVFLVTLILVLLPVALFLKNVSLFHAPTGDEELLRRALTFSVSACIPARDEAVSIRASLESLLSSTHTDMEILVLDDHSTDETASIVQEISEQDQRVRLIRSESLPEGWNGKQFACWQLANAAKGSRLLFLDADVRVVPEGVQRVVAEQIASGAMLVSGFPRQVTQSFTEKLLIPLMHYLLLCYLPIDRMRRSSGPEFAAGCGQLFCADREAYFKCGGHQSIARTRHDGIALPRAFRKAGFQTDLFDATAIASCRMYNSFSSVIRGLLKNASEGIANPKLIFVFTLLLFGGSLLAPAMVAHTIYWQDSLLYVLGFLLLTLVSFAPRLIAASRFQQSLLGALLHPISIFLFLLIQWLAFAMKVLGVETTWRGRKS